MRTVAGMSVLGMTATPAGAQIHPATYTLNDVMPGSFAWDMLAAPTGAAVAWVFNAKGCGNIWVLDASHGPEARKITPYTKDAAFDIGTLASLQGVRIGRPRRLNIALSRGTGVLGEVQVAGEGTIRA